MMTDTEAYIQSMEHFIKGIDNQIKNEKMAIDEALIDIEHDKETIELAIIRREIAVKKLEEYKAEAELLAELSKFD